MKFQFRLRTLFAITTIVALQCAAIGWAVGDRQRLIRERDGARSDLDAALLVSAEKARDADEYVHEISALLEFEKQRAAVAKTRDGK